MNRHPCAGWCEERLHSVVAGLKRRGEIDEDFTIELIPLRERRSVQKDIHTMRCEHNREWMIKEVIS